MADEPQSARRPSRRAEVADANLNPSSLVGSFLHVLEADMIVAEGIVVAEPGPGIYLVECRTKEGDLIQTLVSVREMLDEHGTTWRFYDDEPSMREGFAAWLTRAEREQA